MHLKILRTLMFSSNSTKLQPEKIFTHVIKLPFMGMHSIQMVKFLHSEEIAERQKKESCNRHWLCVGLRTRSGGSA